MAAKSNADLNTEIGSDIISETAPDSITPTSLGAVLNDLADSAYNKVDGIAVTGMTIPAAFTSYVNNGDLLQDILSAIMARVNALQTAVTGGISGLIGEFLAKIMGEDFITVTGVARGGGGDHFVDTLMFPNDTTNGGFDNGNNWLLNKYVASEAITFSTVKCSGLSIKLISNPLTTGCTDTWKIKLVKNRGGGETVLATSDTFDVDSTIDDGTMVYGKMFYIPEFSNSSPVVLSASDKIEVVIFSNMNSTDSFGDQIQIVSGLVTAQI